MGSACAQPAATAPTATKPIAATAAARSESDPLLAVNVDDAFKCAHTLQGGVMSTRALINYAYADPAARPGTHARSTSALASAGLPGITLKGQRVAQESVCRMWQGHLRALEVSALLREIAAEHPDRKDVIVLGVAAQD